MAEKLPYFKFYPADFMGSSKVQMMEPAECGIYIKLLCHSWQEGPLPDDPARLARATGATPEEMERAWPAVRRCFDVDGNGMLYHHRLEDERAAAIDRRQKARRAGRASARSRSGKSTDAATDVATDARTDAQLEGERSRAPDSESHRSHSTEKQNTETQGPDDGGIARLLGYLPERPGIEGTVTAVSSTVKNPDLWARGLMGMFGPSGTEERLMAKVPEDERPEVLAIALQRIATEGEDYSGNFFRSIVRSVIRERGQTDSPTFGNETGRDISRRSAYRKREAERRREEWEAEDEEADREMAELWDWWEELEADKRQEVEETAKQRAKGVPEPMQRPILIGVMQEYRSQEQTSAAA